MPLPALFTVRAVILTAAGICAAISGPARRPIVELAGIGVSEHHETLTILAPRNHDLTGPETVICMQRARIRGGNTECSR